MRGSVLSSPPEAVPFGTQRAVPTETVGTAILRS